MFLYTNNKLAKRKIKKTISFTIAPKRMQYLGINLPKRQKICSLKTIRPGWKKLKMMQTDGKIHHVLGLEELILFKWLYYPRQSTNSVQSLSKYQCHFSHLYGKTKGTEYNLDSVLRKKDRAGGITFLVLRVIKQHGTRTKADTRSNGTEQRSEK